MPKRQWGQRRKRVGIILGVVTPTKVMAPMRRMSYPRSFYYVAGHAPAELSAKLAGRLRWVKAWRVLMEGCVSGQQAADALHPARSTVCRWEGRLKPEGLRGLEDRSRRLRRVRQKQWGAELVARVWRMRESCHGWGKDKLAPLLREGGETFSISTVGRILKHLKMRRVFREPHCRRVGAGKWQPRRP